MSGLERSSVLGTKAHRAAQTVTPISANERLFARGMTAYLVQVLLPLYSNSGLRFEQELYTEVRNELVARFGGITAYTRAPVHGLWQESEEIVRDDLVIYEIMVETLEEAWWREYRAILEHRFQQQSLVVRAHRIFLL